MERKDTTKVSPILSPDVTVEEPKQEPKKLNKKIYLFGGIILGMFLLGFIIVVVILRNNSNELSPEDITAELSPDGLTEQEVSELDLPTDENGKIISARNVFDENELSINIKEDFFGGLSENQERNENTETYIEDTIYNFFSSVYPEYSSITILPGSLEDNSFKMKSNTGVAYKVNLSFVSDDDEIPTISILTDEGNEIFNYNGRFYIGDTITITDEQAAELFGSSDE